MGQFSVPKLVLGASRGTQNVPVYSRKLPLGATRRTQTVPAFFKIRDPARPAASWGAGRGVRRGGVGGARAAMIISLLFLKIKAIETTAGTGAS